MATFLDYTVVFFHGLYLKTTDVKTEEIVDLRGDIGVIGYALTSSFRRPRS
jgi:hypothetical protein